MTELTVRDVTVRSVVVPLRRPLATKVGDFSRWPLLLIDVTTGQGITGRGYLALPEPRRRGLRTVLEDMGLRRAVSRSPAAAYASAAAGSASPQTRAALAAVAGLDIALWDALAEARAAVAGCRRHAGPVPRTTATGRA